MQVLHQVWIAAVGEGLFNNHLFNFLKRAYLLGLGLSIRFYGNIAVKVVTTVFLTLARERCELFSDLRFRSFRAHY